MDEIDRRRLVVHGQRVDLDCRVEEVSDRIDLFLGRFTAAADPTSSPLACGSIRPFDQEDVVRSVSPNAVACCYPEHHLDLYRDAERYWLVDDRWGICQLNLLKRTWTSWVIQQPRTDPVQLTEWAVLWPMAQVLRGRGLHLLPAAAVVRDGFALLLISSTNLAGELQALARAGFKLIGQRWVALREEEGAVALLQMPGVVELTTERLSPFRRSIPYTDLLGTFLGGGQDRALCDAVILTGPGRRGPAAIHRLSGDDALGMLRRRWPIAELHPVRAQGMAHRLATTCAVYTLHLSRNPTETVDLIARLRYTPAPDRTA